MTRIERKCKRCNKPLPHEKERSINDQFSWEQVGLCPACLYDNEMRRRQYNGI